MWATVEQGDVSLSKLLLRTVGSDDESLILQLIQENNLDPPYISTDPNFVTLQAASGTVTFTLTGSSAVTIPQGTVVKTTPGPSGEVRSYTTTQQVTLTTTGQTANVGVVCTVPGPLGNVGPGRVTVTSITGVTVVNQQAISGGYALHVLTVGDRVWIPDANTTIPSTIKERLPLDRYDLSGGVGIYITPLGGFLWGDDDLKLASGSEEIILEVLNRLVSPVNTVLYAPGQGSLLPSLKGTAGNDVLQQVAILAKSTALQDDRIADATFTAYPYSNGWIVLEGTLTLPDGQQISVTLPIS